MSEHYTLTLMTPNFAPEPTGLPFSPIAIGTVGPAMLRFAGEWCDGVRLHPFSTRRHIADFCTQHIAAGLRRAARTRPEIEIAARPLGRRCRSALSVRELRVTEQLVRIPLILGGTGRRALERAAKVGDGWYGPMVRPHQAIALQQTIAARRAELALSTPFSTRHASGASPTSTRCRPTSMPASTPSSCRARPSRARSIST